MNTATSIYNWILENSILKYFMHETIPVNKWTLSLTNVVYIFVAFLFTITEKQPFTGFNPEVNTSMLGFVMLASVVINAVILALKPHTLPKTVALYIAEIPAVIGLVTFITVANYALFLLGIVMSMVFIWTIDSDKKVTVLGR